MTQSKEGHDAGVSGAEIRANLLKWIERLEANDLPQSQSQLRSQDGFCCLGVACEVMAWDWEGYDAKMPGMQTIYDERGDEEYEVAGTVFADAELTREALEVLGLTRAEHDTCVRLNDDEQKTFPQIAAWLRENVLPRYPEKAAVESVSPASL